MNRKNIKWKKGMTLVETIVAVGITAMVLGVISWTLISFYRSNAYIIQEAVAVNDARREVEMMVREIREATYSDTGAYPLVSASSTEFIFYSDIDKDNNVERIRYSLNGTTLERGETEATGTPLVYDTGNESVTTLSPYVRNGTTTPLFRYFDSAGNEVLDTTNLSSISLVKIRMVVNVVESRNPEEFTIYSTAQIRNFKPDL